MLGLIGIELKKKLNDPFQALSPAYEEACFVQARTDV